ncbi:MAG: hypothetical protein H6741_06375 [Alphaproteobacteria bacterium]|nr:hypothetical protein [Alphaproteobacteria bacterium]MCB9792336.1 hypothetical protein [Alphaproteobacteria bacterium]
MWTLLALLLAPPALAQEPAAEPGPFPWSGQSAGERERMAREALQAELDRSLTELALPGETPPWFVAYDLVDGSYYTAFAELGALMQDDLDAHRILRVEVRTGDANFDSANFEAFGEPDGVVSLGVPDEADVTALRHFAWLGTDRAYKQAVEQLSRKQAALAGLPDEDKPQRAMNPVEPVVTPPAEPRPVQPERVREAVVRLSGALADYPELEGAQAAGRDWQGTRLLMSSEGMVVSQATGLAVIRVEATLRLEDGTRLRDGRWWVADSAGELPPVEEMEAEVREMADWLLSLQDAPVLDEYLGPVLFEAPASVELFRQLAAAELVGTPPAQEGPDLFGAVQRRRATGRVGRRLLPEGWTLTDDPTLAEAVGDYAYDHEGVPAQRVVLIEDGVVQRLLHSRVPAGPADQSTGHGRSLGSGRREALPAVVRVEPARPRSERALHRKALRMAAQTGRDEVLVIRRLEPPAMTEDFDVFFTGEGPPPGLTPPYEAYLLGSDGQLTPVRGASFSGVDRRVMRDIVMAGEVSDFVGVLDSNPGPARFHVGAVGGMPASWAAPPILISELELNGDKGGEPRTVPPPPR